MMKKRATAVVVGAGLLCLNLIAADFQGRPLRSWLTEFDSCFITGPNAAWQSTSTLAAVSNAVLAVKAAGTNSIPVLVEMIGSTNFEDPWRALCGFRVLGTNGSGARQDLLKLVKTRESSDSALALTAVGFCNDLPPLMKDPRPEVRAVAAIGLSDATNCSEAVPALLTGITDTDPVVRSAAASALGELQVRPEAVVRPLIGLLQDPAPSVRSSAAFALGKYGSHAKSAVPDLSKLARNSQGEEKLKLLSALQMIDRNAAKEAMK